MTPLEREFNEAMLGVYANAKRFCNYNATYFLQMLHEKGGRATAKYLIATEKPSEGFTALWECQRLDITVEAVVQNPIYTSLFTAEELRLAKERLEQYGFSPKY